MYRVCLIAFVFLISSPGWVRTASADLVLNGSFEMATGPSGLPDDWFSTGNLQVIQSQGETHGTNALAFSYDNLPSNGAIWQSFATVPSGTYALTFDFGKYSINQPSTIARLQVDVFDGVGFSGLQILDQRVTDGTPDLGNSTDSPDVYSSFRFEFVANGTSSTLRFTDFSDPQVAGGGFDAMLDNVVVSAVPEPSSLALTALAGLAMLVRRRRWTLGRVSR